MPVTGVPAFDAVAILEVERISFVGQDFPLVAHGAFINTKTGNTYGSTTCRRWSPRTMDLLKELRASMEEDLGRLVFEADGGNNSPVKRMAEPSGIGEHAGTESDVPTI